MKRYLFILSALFFLVFSVNVSFAASRIMAVAGESIGSVKLGTKISSIEKNFGTCTFKKVLASNDVVAKYDGVGLLVQYQGYTEEIRFLGTSFRELKGFLFATPEGISVGDSREKAESIYGKPAQIIPVTSKDIYPNSKELVIYKNGLAFHYDSNSKICVLLVFNPALFGY